MADINVTLSLKVFFTLLLSVQVARVQIMVLDSVKNLAASGQNNGQIQAAINKLNSELMDVTTVS